MASQRITTALGRCIIAVLHSRSLSWHQPLPSSSSSFRLHSLTKTPVPWGGIRYYSRSASDSVSKVYMFEDIKSFSSNPSPDRILIDSREPGEFKAGAIPTAINLPIVSAPEALSLPADEFEDRFGFAKPEIDKEIVFYCKAGIRSSAAAQLALQNGYQRVGEYRGSWMDWEKKIKEGM